MKKRILAWVICFVLLACNWLAAGEPALAASHVLEISSARELNEFAEKVNEGNTYRGYTVKLVKDIEFDGTVNNFIPIGRYGNAGSFQGTFDGNYHTISGIDVSVLPGGGYFIGLFGQVGAGGTVKNVYLKDCSFASDGAVVGSIAGCLAGGIVGTGFNNAKIQNCYNTGHAAWGIGYQIPTVMTVSKCYCSEESAESNFSMMQGVEKGCKAYPEAYMQGDEFLGILNASAQKAGWLEWEFREDVSPFPVHIAGLRSQTIETAVTNKSYRVAALKKGSKSFRIGAKAKTKLSYKVTKGSKYVSVTSKGKVTVKKGTPKGTYKVRVTAGQSSVYESAAKTIKIVVK